MAVDDDINPDIQDLITRIKTLSKDVAQADNQYAPPLTSTQKQKLLAATKSLTEKLESPDTVIWKVIFGVRSSYPYQEHLVLSAIGFSIHYVGFLSYGRKK